MTGMGNLFDLMRNAREMLDKAKAAKTSLAGITVGGEAGGGMVTAIMNGTGELMELRFDKTAMNADDLEMLGDLIVSAVSDARRKAEAARADALRDMAGGVDLSKLGIDLGGLL